MQALTFPQLSDSRCFFLVLDCGCFPPSPARAMPRPAPPTLEDVARAAEVSTATVSRCLNEPERVASATRERIMAAVEQLAYSPNFGARALASKRTNTYGAVIPTMANAIFARGLQAFQETLAAERGATLLVASTNYDAAIEEHQIRSMVARGADALLLIGSDRSESIYRFLAQHGVPVAIAWSYDPASPHDIVGFDNRAAMRELAERALALGHRRFACISAWRQHNDRAQQRVAGVQQALENAGLDPGDIPIIETDYDIEAGGRAFETLVQSAKPTIVLCGNDVLAAGAIKRASSMGLRIPQDVSITGFDDLEIATLVEPGVTTVHVPHRQMGREAARVLMRERDGEILRLQLATHLVERNSLGPASR